MNILLVDDDVKFLQSYINGIIKLRPTWDYMVADSTGRAISYCRNVRFDCIVAHMQARAIDYFSLRRELFKQCPDVPCIMLSRPYASIHWTTTQLGLSALLTKPIDYDDLVQSVEKAIDVAKLIKLKEEFLYPVGVISFTWEGKEYERFLCSDYVIGRDSSCDIRIPSPKVSRSHFQLSREFKEKSYIVTDMSRNGVEVNGKKVMGYQLLKHDDVIEIPGCEFRYASLNLTESKGDDTHTGEENDQR